jgi:hypothetical protein
MPLPREQSLRPENRSETVDADLRPKYALTDGTNTGLVSIPMGVLLGDSTRAVAFIRSPTGRSEKTAPIRY